MGIPRRANETYVHELCRCSGNTAGVCLAEIARVREDFRLYAVATESGSFPSEFISSIRCAQRRCSI
jgi:hypothetical protein